MAPDADIRGSGATVSAAASALDELRDPSGSQATLRADGVPVSVTCVGQPNPSYRNYFTGKPPSYVAALL